MDQIRWLLAGRVVPRRLDVKSADLKRISLGQLNNVTAVLSATADSASFELAAKSVFHLPLNWMVVAATMCLFGDCPFPSLTELEALMTWAANEATCGEGGLDSFLSPLTDLKELFDARVGGGFSYCLLLLTALHSFSWKSYYWQPGGLLAHC